MTPLHYALLAFVTLIFGGSAPIIRFAVAPAMAIVVWRAALAWPILAVIALIRREKWPGFRAAAAGAALALHWSLWIVAVQKTTIGSASLLVCTGALWAAILSQPLLKEKISRRQWFGLLIALVGVAAVLTAKGGGANHSFIGDLYALGGAFAWVAYAFIGRKARQNAGFWSYTAALYATTNIVTLICALGLQIPLSGYSTQSWWAIITIAILPTLLGHGTVNYLLRFIGPAKLSLSQLMVPVLAAILAMLLFNEIPSVQAVAGGALTLVGVAVGIWPTRN